MRQIIFTVALFVGLFAASATVGNAQARYDYFPTGEACIAALKSGTVKFYTPSFMNMHRKPRKGNVAKNIPDEEIRGLEADACVNMLTVKGYQWVAQREGEQMIFLGSTIKVRYDCGNPILGIMYPTTVIVDVPVIPVAPKCPEGSYPSETPGVCIVEKDKIVTNTVTVNQNVFPCPVFTGARYGSKGFGARMPSALELLVGAGKGAVIGYLGSNERRGQAALLSAGLSAVDTTVTNLLIPDYNVLYLEGPFAIMVKKGKSTTSPDGRFILSWEKGGTILGTLTTGEVCFAGAVQKSFNTGSIAIVNRRGNVRQNIPIKTAVRTDRPGTPGTTLPVGNNGPVGGTTTTTTGIPTRTRRGNSFVEDAYGNPLSAQPVNSASSSGSTCKGQITISPTGRKRCVGGE